MNLADPGQAGEDDKQVEGAPMVAQQRRKQGPIPDIGSGAGFADEEDVMSMPGQAGQIGVGGDDGSGFLGEGDGFGRKTGQGAGLGDGFGLEKWKRCLGKGLLCVFPVIGQGCVADQSEFFGNGVHGGCLLGDG